MQVKNFELTEEIGDKLPKASGYKILVACPQIEETTKGGIIIAEELRAKESTASIFGYVVQMGKDAYKDNDKFPSASIVTGKHLDRS